MKLDPAHDLLGNEELNGSWMAVCACGEVFLADKEKAASDLWLDHEVGETVGAAPVVQWEGRCMLCGRDRPVHISLSRGIAGASRLVGVMCKECWEGLDQPPNIP